MLGERLTILPAHESGGSSSSSGAAADAARGGHILVVGSQAILASFSERELPLEATVSIEADIAFFNDDDEAKADKVDGAIGEASMFHQSFGYYGQGVGLSTAVLPSGWEKRVVPFVWGDWGCRRGLP